jgi:hypothetical protein
MPAIRIRLDDESAVRPVEITHLPLNYGVHQRPRQTMLVAQLAHEPFKATSSVDWAAVRLQLRFERASTGASGVAREERMQLGEVEAEVELGLVQGGFARGLGRPNRRGRAAFAPVS